jgi:hypothetical protein
MEIIKPSLWESEGGEVDAVFYHDEGNLAGCNLELERRRDIEALIDGADLLRITMEAREGKLTDGEPVIPIPNTNDLVGVLRGEVDLDPDYKRLHQCKREDLAVIIDFKNSYIALLDQEQNRLREYFELPG